MAVRFGACIGEKLMLREGYDGRLGRVFHRGTWSSAGMVVEEMWKVCKAGNNG